MAGSVGPFTGGTRSLLALIEEHAEAVEYVLITHGLRLRDVGTRRFNWRDLLVIVKQSPASSALYRAVHGQEESEWTLTNHLLAGMGDSLAWLVWAKTEDAAKKRNKPKPIPRPGVRDESKKQIGGGTLPADEMMRWLGWEAPDDISELEELPPFEDKSPRTKLDANKVRAIRSSGDPRTELAAEYAVSVSTIADVIHGRTWKHVT